MMLAWNARRDMACEAYEMIETHGVPLYATPVRCGRAFAALSDYAQARRTRSGVQRPEPPCPAAIRMSSTPARCWLLVGAT